MLNSINEVETGIQTPEANREPETSIFITQLVFLTKPCLSLLMSSIGRVASQALSI